jgi:hypothetical protein
MQALLLCFLLGAVLLQARASEPLLVVEPVDLGELVLGEQRYNLQEQGLLRVFARSAAGFKRSRLYLQRRGDDGRWTSPEALPFSDPRWRDSDPHLSADGRTLTFVSDRPASGETPLPQMDLYESRWVDGRWSAPQRLAEAWQSPAYELGPERYGEQLYLASARPGGPGKLAIYRVGAAAAPPQALPAPVNVGANNSDFTLSPDGRYALWWSDRDGASGGAGELYLAERVGQGFGPALRLPAPINGPDFEFTPSVSADGQWLYFASTRGGRDGLSGIYRVSWPALLQSLGAAAQAFSQAALDAEISALWRAIGHGPGQPSDLARLAAIFHPQARIQGQHLRDSQLGLDSWSVPDFLNLLATPGPRGLVECEIQREQRRYGAHAQVYSVVQTRREPGQARASYTGVNSMQWQLGPQGWQLLALHYALALPGLPLPVEAAPCIA